MKNKTVVSVAAIVVFIIATAGIIIFNNRSKQNNDDIQNWSSMEEAAESAAFDMEYPDRLCGIPVTGFETGSDMLEVRYGERNYIRKALGITKNRDKKTAYDEISEQNVNGMTVTFKGCDGLVSLAAWNDNHFEYVIYTEQGVPEDEMIEYIEATR